MGNYAKNLPTKLQKKEGYCVICGDYGELTRDHVPSKGCNNKSDMVLKTIFPSYKKGKKTENPNHQGGTNFNP